jgi:uncharacterized protein (DUF1501 family)
MLPLTSQLALTRRHAIVAGGLGTLGLSLPQLLAAEKSTAAEQKSVIFIVPWGGPAQMDTLDPKPDASEEVRGEFRPIATKVTGLRICEHLPKLAARADRFAVVRSLSHAITAHNPATYYTLTGHIPTRMSELIPPERNDWPALGAVLAKDAPPTAGAPGYVVEPAPMVEKGVAAGGQHAGSLGTRYDPLVVNCDPSSPDFTVPDLTPAPDLTPNRLAERRGLLAQLESKRSAPQSTDGYREQAYDLLGAAARRDAFDLSREPERTRDRYGRGRFGQSVLLARRLVEAGVRLVLVNDAAEKTNERWDTHEGTYPKIEKNLSETDAGLSALLDDLRDRGLLETTIVVWLAEFGRSPKSDSEGGRDHWPRCYSGLFAGGGIRGGVVHGSSDPLAAYPRDGACAPEDVHATIYHLLGLPLRTELTDATGRPGRRCEGAPIRALC